MVCFDSHFQATCSTFQDHSPFFYPAILADLTGIIIALLHGYSVQEMMNIAKALDDNFLSYTIIGPTCLAYMFWFIATKYGNRNLVISLSFLIPVGSVLFISLLHAIPVKPVFWISVFLIISGALLGMKAARD